ncbi:glycosyltransferase family 2 protein [Prevotella sp. 10(H)]|uniref:glycosyltransferase family 2 protein n=1 Tax=Prevotella sp. 10(H) TaxID=1158294 RepID=UPI00068CE273|nr:glycosyltransferase family 2 protein [Prevotella sp. 10(H)]
MKENDSEFKIAIIIPAYKSEFLSFTLDSLSNQTDKNFRVYIGDDNSPANLYEIVSRYEDNLKIFYKRYKKNMGGKDLVAHWNRCLEMIQDEAWFIMFSDDDLMDPDCIKLLREEIQKSDNDVFHFNLKIIDTEGNITNTPPQYPGNLSSIDFFKQLYSYKIDARMPEFVFRLSHFRKTGGFIPFNLAMCSDNATVMNCAYEKGIRTIENAYVQWRYSGKNVSSSTDSVPVNEKMFKALIDFFNWTIRFCKRYNIKYPFTFRQRMAFLLEQREIKAQIIDIEKSWQIFFNSDGAKRYRLFLPYINMRKRRICHKLRR